MCENTLGRRDCLEEGIKDGQSLSPSISFDQKKPCASSLLGVPSSGMFCIQHYHNCVSDCWAFALTLHKDSDTFNELTVWLSSSVSHGWEETPWLCQLLWEKAFSRDFLTVSSIVVMVGSMVAHRQTRCRRSSREFSILIYEQQEERRKWRWRHTMQWCVGYNPVVISLM